MHHIQDAISSKAACFSHSSAMWLLVIAVRMPVFVSMRYWPVSYLLRHMDFWRRSLVAQITSIPLYSLSVSCLSVLLPCRLHVVEK